MYLLYFFCKSVQTSIVKKSRLFSFPRSPRFLYPIATRSVCFGAQFSSSPQFSNPNHQKNRYFLLAQLNIENIGFWFYAKNRISIFSFFSASTPTQNFICLKFLFTSENFCQVALEKIPEKKSYPQLFSPCPAEHILERASEKIKDGNILRSGIECQFVRTGFGSPFVTRRHRV